MRASRRTQPMRRSAARRETPALAAAQKGAPKFMRNPADTKRAAARRRRRRKPQTEHPLRRILGVRRAVKRPY